MSRRKTNVQFQVKEVRWTWMDSPVELTIIRDDDGVRRVVEANWGELRWREGVGNEVVLR